MRKMRRIWEEEVGAEEEEREEGRNGEEKEEGDIEGRGDGVKEEGEDWGRGVFLMKGLPISPFLLPPLQLF